MRRITYLLVGIAALFAVGLAVMTVLIANNPFAPAAESELVGATDGDEAREVIVVSEPTPVPAPNVAELADAVASSMIDPRGGDMFANLEIVMAGELPKAPATLPSYTLDFNSALELAEMEQIAVLFGFTSGLFEERIDRHMGAYSEEAMPVDLNAVESAEQIISDTVDTMVFDDEWYGPESYVAFDGTRRLNFYGSTVNMQDSAFMDELWSGNPQTAHLAFDQALPLAEAYLLERDLLPDSYEASAGWDGAVQFFEILDGVLFKRPIATVHYTLAGDLASIDYVPTVALELVDEMGVISAETAFETLRAAPHKQQFDFHPIEPFGQPEEWVAPRNWQRQYEEGDEVTRMVWLQVFDPTEGGAPVIWAENMRLSGPDDILIQLAQDGAQRSTIVTGIFTKRDGIETLEVSSFETSQTPQEVYMNGTIERDGEAVLLKVPGGLTLRLPDAPAELEAGITVGVFGFSISNAEDGQPVFDWIGIDEQVDYASLESYEEPFPGESDPFAAREMTVDSVRLIYQSYYGEMDHAFAGPFENAKENFIPMWQFSGLSDNGMTIDFSVPAVDLTDVGN